MPSNSKVLVIYVWYGLTLMGYPEVLKAKFGRSLRGRPLIGILSIYVVSILLYCLTSFKS